jgi:hypothetical protein
MNLFYGLKGWKSDEIKAQLTINRVVTGVDYVFVNLSVINNHEKPFSIMQMFIQNGKNTFEACRIIKIGEPAFPIPNAIFLDTHMGQFEFNCREYCSIDFFNTTAYLLANQAETGWVCFNMPSNALIINRIGLKISGVDELIYTVSE